MQFIGISPDEEGSIIYDGEKFIVRNPRKIPANFNPGSIPVIGLPPDHPSRRAPLPPAPQPFSHAPPPPPPKTAPKNQAHAEPQLPAAPQPKPPDYQQYISWLPEREERQAMAFLDAALDGLRLTHEDAALTLGEALYKADPEGAESLVKIITGMTPVNGSETISELAAQILNIGLPGFIASKSWATMKLSALEQGPDESPPIAIDPYAQPEINLLTQYYLAEAYPGWDPARTDKADLRDYLVARLHGFIPDFDATLRNWDDYSVRELIAIYRYELGEQSGALWRANPDAWDEAILAVSAEFERATTLLAMSVAMPLDDTDAYAASFAGRVKIKDAAAERLHVQEQLALIYKHLEIPVADDHLDSRSAIQLKYELYYRLHYDVRQFLDDDENEAQIQAFIPEWLQVARDTTDGVIERLQGRSATPDVVGFLFLMGLTMVFEPLDWAMAAVEVAKSLAEGDIGGALATGLAGIMPFVPSATGKLLRHGIDAVGDVARAAGRVAETAEDFAVKHNKFNHTSVEEAFRSLRANEKYSDLHDVEIRRMAIERANKRNSEKLRRQLEWARDANPAQWEWRVPRPGQHAHHIVPSGDASAKLAREHMESLGISVNSAYNGVGLSPTVHHLTFDQAYVTAINDAVPVFRKPEELVNFLDRMARELNGLSKYAHDSDRLKHEFGNFLVTIKEIEP